MYLRRTLFRLSNLTAPLATALPSQAQQAGPVSSDNVRIQKVEVKASADTYDARRDDTASKIVLSHADIIKYGDTSVLDVPVSESTYLEAKGPVPRRTNSPVGAIGRATIEMKL